MASSASVQFIDKYLAAPPYYGHSHIADCAFIKHTIEGTGGFDRSKGPSGMWHTSHVHRMIDLVASGKFQPYGIEPNWNGEFLERARTYAANAEAAWLSKSVEARLNRAAWEETNMGDKKRKLEAVPLRPASPAPQLTDKMREALRAKAKADQAEKITGTGGGKRPRNAVSSQTLRKQQAAAKSFFVKAVR